MANLGGMLSFFRRELGFLLDSVGSLHTDHGIHGRRELKPPR